VSSVVEPDADDLLGVRHRGKQGVRGKLLALGIRYGRGQFGHPVGNQQPAHRTAAPAERIPGIDHAIVTDEHPGSGPTIGLVADDAHRGDGSDGTRTRGLRRDRPAL
jgi:hypothetical protein